MQGPLGIEGERRVTNPKSKIQNIKLLFPAFQGGKHFGLRIDAQRIGDAVNVIEIRNDLDGIEDVPIGQSLLAEDCQVSRAHRGRLPRHQHCELCQSFLARSQSGAPIVALDLLGQRGVTGFDTEILPVSFDSIEAVVGPGNDCGKQLALGA